MTSITTTELRNKKTPSRTAHKKKKDRTLLKQSERERKVEIRIEANKKVVIDICNVNVNF